MKIREIKVNETYKNRGKGTTMRIVKAISDDYRPEEWFSSSPPPDEPGVLYLDNKGVMGRLYLSSFAKWAGGIIEY